MSSKKSLKMTSRSSFVIAGAFTILIVLMASVIVPWIFGVVEDAQHVYQEDVPEENRGVYIITEAGVIQLFNWQLPLMALPDDAPVVDAESFQALSIVMKQIEPANSYQLFEMETGDLVSWQNAWRDGRQLLLDPGSLSAGDFMMVIPTDDLFGEKTYHYFRIR